MEVIGGCCVVKTCAWQSELKHRQIQRNQIERTKSFWINLVLIVSQPWAIQPPRMHNSVRVISGEKMHSIRRKHWIVKKRKFARFQWESASEIIRKVLIMRPAIALRVSRKDALPSALLFWCEIFWRFHAAIFSHFDSCFLFSSPVRLYWGKALIELWKARNSFSWKRASSRYASILQLRRVRQHRTQ